MRWPWRKEKATTGLDPVNLSTLANPEQWLVDLILGSLKSKAGVTVNKNTVLGVCTVYACVNVVARQISTLPMKLHRRVMKFGRMGRDEARDHPLFDLLATSPNEEMTSTDFRMAMQASLSLRQNAYAQIVRDRALRPMELWPLEYHDVRPARSKSGALVYDIARDHEPNEVLAADRVLHLKGLGFNGLCGDDLIGRAQEALGLAIALQENAARFFGNDSRPGAVFETPNALSDGAFARLKKELEEKHGGVQNAYKTIILEEGLKLNRSRSDNTDSQFDESRKATAQEICRLFGIPPHKVGIVDNMPRANVEEQNREFAVDVLATFAGIWEQTLNWRLLTARERTEYYFKLDLRGLLRGAVKDRHAAYAVGRQWGWLSANDVRELEDMDPIEHGDEYLRPMNMTLAGAPVTEGESEEEDETEEPSEDEEEDRGERMNLLKGLNGHRHEGVLV